MQKFRPILIALLTLWLCAANAWAQGAGNSSEKAPVANGSIPPIPPAPSGSPEAESRQTDPLPGIPGNVVWLKAEGGRLVPVPLDAKLQDFLEWLKTQNHTAPDQPEYSIASISFTGSADEERANLTAKIQVQIQRENAWVRVPLRMGEAIQLPGSKHSGVGEGIPAGGVPLETNFEQGITWHLKGRGLHELTIPVVVPIRKQPARRLSLSLTLPKATASSLKIEVPAPQLRVTPMGTALLQTRPSGKGATEIEAVGLGELLDLRWMPQSDIEPSLAVQTSIRLSLPPGGTSILLKADQKIRARQGLFQRFKVQLPPGFELLSALEMQSGQPRLDGRQYGRDDVDESHAVTIELSEPTEGPVDFQWELEAPFPANGQLSLSGFQVEKARLQQGEIGISSAEGFLIRHLGGEAVRRVNISDLSLSQIDSAYRFNQQPYRLDMRIEEIEPQYGGEPVYFLLASADGIELIADLHYTLTGGAVSEVELRWPGWRGEGWKLIDSPRTETNAVDVQYQDDSWRIRVADPSKQEFRVRFRTKLEFPGRASAATFSLPQVVAPSRTEPIVVIADEENVESSLEPADGTPVRPLPAFRRGSVNVPESLAGMNRDELQIDSSTLARFKVGVTVHQRQVKAKSEVEAELKETQLHVNQQIVYDVKFEPTNEISLLVPKSLERRVQFSLLLTERELPLNPIWTPHENATAEKARFTLPEPMKGEIRVSARYLVPIPEDLPQAKEESLSLPLIHSTDPQIVPVQLTVRNSKVAEISVADVSWTPQFSPAEAVGAGSNSTTWMTLGEATSIPLRLSLLRQDSAQEFTVQKCYIRTSVNGDASAKFKAQYRIEGAIMSLELGLPTESKNPSFWWDDRALEALEQPSTMTTMRGYRLPISDDVERGSHLLTVEYSLPFEDSVAWTLNRELPAPRFAANIWVEQTAWEVVTPPDRYLWSYPEGFIPEFHWQRRSFFWSRVAKESFNTPGQWIGATDGPVDATEAIEGNSYIFSRAAPAVSLRMVSLHQSMVLLVGAGIALGVGFILLKVPASRTVMTPLVLAFVAAVLWLVAPAPFQLLLQPAILGLLLAVLAAVIDGVFHRDRSSVVLTVAPTEHHSLSHGGGAPSATTGSTASRPVLLGAGSDDPTAMRPATDELAGSLSSYNSGAGR